MNTDLEIIQAIAQGNQKAFEELYNLYASKVYNTALSYCKNVEEAEEITQDVFLKLHLKAGKFKGQSSASTWIYRIAVNTSLNTIKKKKLLTLFDPTRASKVIHFEHPGVLLEQSEDAKALYLAMDCLPLQQKTAFILSFIEELPRQKVADIMALSLKSVESLLQRAKKNLRVELEKTFPNRGKLKK